MNKATQVTMNAFLVAVVALTATPSVWSSPDDVAESIREWNRQGDWHAALSVLSAIEDDAPWAALLRAETHWHSGNLNEARDRIRDIPSTDRPFWIRAQELSIRIEYLEGNIEACQTASSKLLAAQPENPTALRFLATCYLRTGAYDRALQLAERYVESATNPISSRTLQADVLEARGDIERANTIRRSVIPILNDSSDLDTTELIAGSRALRNIGEFEAANQCIQLAQDIDITDPFMKLEKIRLYRATQGYGIAGKTAYELTQFYVSFPLAYAEWAEVKWDMRTKKEDVANLCTEALMADPTLLDARCRLIFYATLKDDHEERDALIAQNLNINPNHRRTRNLQRAAEYLAGKEEITVPIEDDPAFAKLMVNIMTAKNDYKESLRWASAYANGKPNSSDALHELGLAKFRTGAYTESRSLLERSLIAQPYALQTRNLLTYIDGIVDHAVTESGILRVGYPRGEQALARFAQARGTQILLNESKTFNANLNRPLRIQLCNNLDDLAVITEGIPFGCCVDPAHPATTGVVNFDDAIFLWTPKATRGARPNYRWDEALHRGIVQAVVRAATNDKAPLWLQEGIAGYAIWRENQEWAPPDLGYVMGQLHRGMKLPVADLAEGFLGSRRPFYQVYAPLLIQDWTERFGHSAIQRLLAEIAHGATWTVALERALGQSIDLIDEESRSAILLRYEALSESTEEATKHARVLFDTGRPYLAALTILKALERNPYDPNAQMLVLDLLDTLSIDGDKPDTYFRLLEATLLVKRSDADARFQLANWHTENDRKDQALGYCQSAVGIRPGWLAAHRLLTDIALELDRYDVAYASLATLHEARPKHVKILENLVVCARALDMNEESTRWTQKLQVLAPQSSLVTDPPNDRGGVTAKANS